MPQVFLLVYLRILLQPLCDGLFPFPHALQAAVRRLARLPDRPLLARLDRNQYMSVYAHLRLDIRKDRVEIKHVEKKVEELEERKAA